jgi:hypothetical protein
LNTGEALLVDVPIIPGILNPPILEVLDDLVTVVVPPILINGIPGIPLDIDVDLVIFDVIPPHPFPEHYAL